MNRRILYIQYTNPAGYPPLQHSSRILADCGWNVRFIGTTAVGVGDLDFPPHPNISVQRWRYYKPGLAQKIHYLLFNLWIVGAALAWRPTWIYASDPLSCPAALMLKSCGFSVVYHEHDSPGPEVSGQRSEISTRRAANGNGTKRSTPHVSAFQRFLLRSRVNLARKADLCVLPSENRVKRFIEQTSTSRPVLCVWNCPRREEAVVPNKNETNFTLYYHGNISSELLPEMILQALQQVPEARLLAIGYTTQGNEGYPSKFCNRASELGVSDRVILLGLCQRSELLAKARECSVGWAAMPRSSRNFNFQTMAGASNKAFDYLACGLPLLANDLADWNEMFLIPGYGRACDPDDANSIASALQWYCNRRAETQESGELGRQRILIDWNYETQFEPVLQRLERQ